MNKLLIATALTALVAATGIASAQDSHSSGNLAPGESDVVNRGQTSPATPSGAWAGGQYGYQFNNN